MATLLCTLRTSTALNTLTMPKTELELKLNNLIELSIKIGKMQSAIAAAIYADVLSSAETIRAMQNEQARMFSRLVDIREDIVIGWKLTRKEER